MKTDSKQKVITKHQIHAKDTGSSKVQIAIMTERINQLTEHLKAHKKDNHSRRGLLRLVGGRKKMLHHLKLNDADGYQSIIKELGIRG